MWFLRVIFLPFFNIVQIAREKSKNFIRCWQTAPIKQNVWGESLSFKDELSTPTKIFAQERIKTLVVRFKEFNQ